MARTDATTIAFECVEFMGQPVLFTDWRIDRSTIPDGLHLYEVRHFINADIVKIFSVVTSSANTLVFFLQLPTLQKHIPKLWYQRERSAA